MEIETLEQLARLLSTPGRSLAGVCLQDLDLTADPAVADRLAAASSRGLVVLGGDYPAGLLRTLIAGGATVLPAVPDVPFDPYLSTLYRADDLYAGLDGGYASTVDASCYRWYTRGLAEPNAASATFAAIHDASVSDALAELLVADGRPVVAVMGGHGVRRGDTDYRAAADLGAKLAGVGALVATGGGPGAMEAVNLGALFGSGRATELPAAIDRLSNVATFDDITAWAAAAQEVVRDLANGPADEVTRSGADPAAADIVSGIGIPTWYYGHEPPNMFAGRIAKYFSNAIREDVLLASATGGVLVLPGSAGTIQEIFQIAARAFYAATEPPPILLVGDDYWRRQLPAWPLLQALATDHPMADRLDICRTVDDAVARLAQMDRRLTVRG